MTESLEDVVGLIDRIEEWLRENAILENRWGSGSEEITTCTGLKDSCAGALSWLSPRVARDESLSLADFRGALLIGPRLEPGRLPEKLEFAYLATSNPKLAFILTMRKFFSQLSEVDWLSAERVGHYYLATGSEVPENCQIAPGVVIGPGVYLGDGCSVGPNTVLVRTRFGKNVRIGANCSIGLDGFGYEMTPSGEYLRFPHLGSIEIGDNVEIGSNTCIDRGSLGITRVGSGVKIDNLVHVAHNVTVGENSMLIAHCMVAGSVTTGKGVWVAPSASIRNQLTIGEGAVVGLGAVVTKNVEPNVVVAGNPAREMRKSG